MTCSGPKSVAELLTGTPPLPTDFLTRANQEWVKNIGRRHVYRKRRSDIGKSHAQKHKVIGGNTNPSYSGPFMRKAQHAALVKMTDHMQARMARILKPQLLQWRDEEGERRKSAVLLVVKQSHDLEERRVANEKQEVDYPVP